MAWTIDCADTAKVDYADTAKGQLRKLDKQTARRIVDFMDERIAGLENPRGTGKALTGPLGGFWRYRVGGQPGDLRPSGRRFACAGGADRQPARCLPIDDSWTHSSSSSA